MSCLQNLGEVHLHVMNEDVLNVCAVGKSLIIVNLSENSMGENVANILQKNGTLCFLCKPLTLLFWHP